MKKILLFTVFAAAALLSRPAFALENNPYPSPWNTEVTYKDKAFSKLGYGAKNALLGWTELFTEFFEDKRAESIGQGLGNAVMNTVGGVLHVVTFPFTGIDVPLPENGVDIFNDSPSV